MTNQAIAPNWNLSDLYTGIDDQQIEADFAEAEKIVEDLITYRGKISKLTPVELLELTHKEEALNMTLHKIGAFVGLLSSTHVNEPEVVRFEKKVEERMVALGQKTLFIATETKEITDEQWEVYKNAPELKDYRLSLEHGQRSAKHTLSEPEEKILSEKSQTSWDALNHLWNITTDTLTVAWEGKAIPLSEALVFLRDPNAEQRKQAAFAIHAALEANQKTTPAVYNTLVHDKAIHDRLRGFEYPEQGRFQSDDVNKEDVTALVAAVRDSYPLVERYYTLKKKLLQLDELHWWDRYAPLPKPKVEISPNEGKTMVLEAFAAFSPEVHTIASNMFVKQHIDWFPSEKKRGGAFCQFGAKDQYPYVLLNYTNDVNDVMTLAHELGHAIHDVLAQENNNWTNAWPSLAQAEIASTFGEALIFDKLMASDLAKEDRIALLMNQIEDNFATIHRQIAMFQFEQAVHTKRREEGELSREQLNDLWHDFIKEPFGNSLTWTDEHKNYWMYVSHVIHTPFYVYSYAFAQLCTLAIYQKYKEQGSAFVPTYLNLLKAGGSKTPKDNLAQAGLDISNPQFWRNGLTIVEQYIDKLEKLSTE